jgi:hypothetical protein
LNVAGIQRSTHCSRGSAQRCAGSSEGMHNVIYIIGLVVVVIAVLSLLGLA